MPGAGGGRSWGGGCPGPFSERLILPALERVQRHPWAGRGRARAGAESEPPEIPLQLILLQPGQGSGSHPALLAIPWEHTAAPVSAPGSRDRAGSGSPGTGLATEPAPVRDGAWRAGAGGQRVPVGSWTQPAPPWVDPGTGSVKYRCFQVPNP